MKLALSVGALVLVGAGLAAALPLASDHGDVHRRLVELVHGKHARHGDLAAHLDALADRLDLTQEQRSEVASLLHSSKIIPRAKTLAEAFDEEFAALHARDLDEAGLRAAGKKVGAAQEELAVTLARLMRDVHGVLTPEQLEKVHALHHGGPPRLADHVQAAEKSLAAWIERHR